MKVLDLCCGNGHTFEGWFASEQDFVGQCERLMVQCPACGDASITKKLSAPRLNLSAQTIPTQDSNASPSPELVQAAVEAWTVISRKVLANTEDVGTKFAEEARRIHYGETESRGIRGQTTVKEAKDLVEEGIQIMPLLLPEALKNPLH
jgi:hypothetical protein